MLHLLCLALVLAGSSAEESCSRPLVATREGVLRGLVARSAAGKQFYSFKGIRYAKAPEGQLRFKPPVRHPGWSGIADASEHGSVCLQYNFFKGNIKEGAEDCLFLNVYTPRLPRQAVPAAGLPVMFWIHGGGFAMGTGDEEYYGPKYLIDEDVVLVTINYRLSVFGFLSNLESSMPGNYGLLDQVMALQWVRDNIAAFGGDPRLVTIFGESAGGASVSLLVVSPLAKGLFHHAISQSGSSLGFWASGIQQKDTAQVLGKSVNCTSQDSQQLLSCLREADAEALLNATQLLLLSGVFTAPRIDPEADTPFLPEDPRVLLERGDFNLVPWLSGLTQEEGALFAPQLTANETALDSFNSGDLDMWKTSAYMKDDPDLYDCGANPDEEVEKVRDFYLATALKTSKFLPSIQLMGDRVIMQGLSEEIRLASAHTAVYKYLLDHTGPGRIQIAAALGLDLPADFGPTHGDDLGYLFSFPQVALPEPDSPEYTMIRFVVSLWASFARTGRPSSSVLPTPNWPIFTEDDQRHMRLNSQPGIGENAFEERLKFWKTVRLNENWRHPIRNTPCKA